MATYEPSIVPATHKGNYFDDERISIPGLEDIGQDIDNLIRQFSKLPKFSVSDTQYPEVHDVTKSDEETFFDEMENLLASDRSAWE